MGLKTNIDWNIHKRITKEGQYAVLHKISPVHHFPDVHLQIVHVIGDTPEEFTVIVKLANKEEQNEQARVVVTNR